MDTSLLEATPSVSGEPRWRILAPLREFGSGLLSGAAADGVRERHARSYEHLVGEHIDATAGCRGAGAVLRLSEEQANLTAAYGWLAQRDPKRALQLAVDLEDFWIVTQQQTEGRRWIDALVDRIQDVSLRCRGLATVLRLDRPLGDAVHGRATLTRLSEARCGEPYVSARKLIDGAWLAPPADREAHLREGLAVAERLGAFALVARAHVVMPNTSRQELERTLTRAKARDFVSVEIGLLNSLGVLEAERGRWPEALAVTREAEELCNALGFPNLIVTTNIGKAQIECGDYAGAEATFRRTIASAFRAGNEHDLGFVLQSFADLACRAGQPKVGATLWAAGQRLIVAVGTDQAEEDAEADETESLQSARASLGEEDFGKAWAAGLDLEARVAVDLALGTGVVSTAS
jgi:hypothetical protein